MNGKPLKEAELREVCVCALCRRKIGQTKMPLFYLVTIERHGLDMRALSRQQGLGMMLGGHGGIAMAMGPDEDMTVVLQEPIRIMVCEDCSTKSTMVAQLAEEAGKAGEEEECG